MADGSLACPAAAPPASWRGWLGAAPAIPAAAAVTDLAVEGVSVAYPNGHVALREASLRLGAPTICGLLGVNGAGKSTLFKAIMGMVRPAAGTVRIGGMAVRQAQKLNRVAYVPQSEEVDWDFPVSVRDVVMMGRYGYMNRLRIPAPPTARRWSRRCCASACRISRTGRSASFPAGRRSESSWPAPWRRMGG
ncbi:metal ABC transporter ATP-binding protein [Pseudoroseomonas wenyumeiae]